MSANDSTSQITGLPRGTPRVTYTLSAKETLGLVGVRATFDGIGAAGAFLPCVKIISDDGTVMAQTIGTSVAAGASADATFAPFLRTIAGSASGGGIAFDTWPQTGDWFGLETSSNDPGQFGDDYGQRYIADVGGIVVRNDDPAGDMLVTSAGTLHLEADTNLEVTVLGTSLYDHTGDVLFNVGNGRFELDSDADIRLDASTTMTLVYRSTGVLAIKHGSTTVFRFDPDGSVHGLAAIGVITWDL